MVKIHILGKLTHIWLKTKCCPQAKIFVLQILFLYFSWRMVEPWASFPYPLDLNCPDNSFSLMWMETKLRTKKVSWTTKRPRQLLRGSSSSWRLASILQSSLSSPRTVEWLVSSKGTWWPGAFICRIYPLWCVVVVVSRKPMGNKTK